MDCLDPDTILALVTFRATLSQRAAAEAHLDECPECRSLVAAVALDGRDDPRPAADPPEPDASGFDEEILRRYSIERPLASGGMGAVFRARARHGSSSPVALKRLVGSGWDERARARFVREAGAARAIEHPNVVRIFEFGETRDGSLYMVMELLEGEDLGARRERGPLEPAEVVDLGGQAAAGLGAAHDAGIVHRDVKPQNLFLCANGVVKVLDFGLALLGSERSRLTSTNLVVGTPSFMAPEQARATKDEDALTDVWALGATLYHALAGRPPFRAHSIAAELVRIATGQPDPLPPGVPPELRRTLMRALKKDRAARWQSMPEFALALATAL